MEGLLLKPEQAAMALGIGRTKLYKVLRSGELASVQIGGSRRISMKALEAHVTSLEKASKVTT
jgi:excisionase family DNA binding protein